MLLSILSFLSIAIMVCITPGPTTLFVLSQSTSGNRKDAITAVLSILLANMIWIISSAVGIAAIIHNSLVAFNILKWIGACYLIYLGISLFKNGINPKANEENSGKRVSILFKGLATSLSNPKALLFYLSFLPQFTNDALPYIPQIMMYGVLYLSVVLCTMSLYAVMGNRIVYFFQCDTLKKWFGRVFGFAFISTGISIFKVSRES